MKLIFYKKFYKGETNEKEKSIYKHKFNLRVGEIAHINGIPCEYLGTGSFGTNTYPGKPRSVEKEK